MKATGEEIREVRLRKHVSSHCRPMFSDSLSPKAQDIYAETKASQAIQKEKVEDNPTDGIFVLCNFCVQHHKD